MTSPHAPCERATIQKENEPMLMQAILVIILTLPNGTSWSVGAPYASVAECQWAAKASNEVPSDAFAHHAHCETAL